MYRGWVWYVELGAWGRYHTDNIYSTYQEALKAGLENGNFFEEIGIEYVETDGLFVGVLREVKTPTQVWWANNHEVEDE